MSTAIKSDVDSPQDAPTTLRWQSWPLRERLPWSLLLPAGLLVIEWGVSRLTGSHAMGAVAMLLLTVSLWRFWLPIRFELSQRGLTQRTLGRTSFIPWRAIGSFRVCHYGVLLIRSHNNATVDKIGSLYLPWGSQRVEVLQWIEVLCNPKRRGDSEEKIISTGSQQ